MRRRKTGRRHDDGRRQGELFPAAPAQDGGAAPGGQEWEASPRRAGGAFATVVPIGDLELPTEALELLGKSYEGLNRMQADSVRAGILEGRSVLVSAPTSGGKTLVALLAILACLSRGAGRAVYLCPMRSLAAEQYRELRSLEDIKINGRAPRVAMTTGDDGAGKGKLAGADVVVMTNERLDALMRKDKRWRERIGLVVVDEVHMVGDAGRGPVLETVVAHAKSMGSRPQLVGLSATAPNADELAEWLGAALVKSEERPVPLREGVYDGEKVRMEHGEGLRVERDAKYAPAVRVGIASALGKDKTLVFADTKPHAVAWAKKAAEVIGPRLSGREREGLRELAGRIAAAGDEPTETVRALIFCVRRGVAFHHAGLGQRHREAVERGFREGAVRLVVSTPTLAVGVNLPAMRVVVSRLTRYDPGENRQVPISVREYKQMAGRAGRPQYGEWGEAIIVSDAGGAELAWKRYIRGRPERVRSHIAGGTSMTAHLLSLVTINPGMAKEDIARFFLMYLARIQEGTARISQAVERGLQFLHRGGFVTREQRGGSVLFAPTELGRLATGMYVEPPVALRLLEAARVSTSGERHTLGLIYAAISRGTTIRIGIRESDAAALKEVLDGNEDDLFRAIRDGRDDVERSTLALWRWTDGARILRIAEALEVEEGTLHAIVRAALPPVRFIGEAARLEGNTGLAGEARELAARIEHGVRPELLDLVGLRHIGRAHAERLHGKGYASRESLRGMSPKRLAGIIRVGERIAGEILEQASAAGAWRPVPLAAGSQGQSRPQA